jgi:hypothetical protein
MADPNIVEAKSVLMRVDETGVVPILDGNIGLQSIKLTVTCYGPQPLQIWEKMGNNQTPRPSPDGTVEPGNTKAFVVATHGAGVGILGQKGTQFFHFALLS